MNREIESPTVSAVATTRHGGRHLDVSRDDALREAALRLLAEIGYDRLTVEAIAACAGAGKATIYRRWSGKAELVVDALTCAKQDVEAPDTGTLRGDLVALSRRSSKEKARLDTSVMVGLVSALPHDPELRAAFQERLVAPHVRELTAVFTRAVERGEIEPVENVDVVASILPALFLHRLLVVGAAPDPAYVETVIDGIIIPLVHSPRRERPPQSSRPH